MRIHFRLLYILVMVIGIFMGKYICSEPETNIVYAASQIKYVNQLDNRSSEAEFTYEMAQITAKLITAPTTDTEKFKVEFAYAAAQVTAKVMPLISDSRKNEIAYDMSLFTTNVITSQTLDIQQAKADLAYKIAQLTSEIINDSCIIPVDRGRQDDNKRNYIRPQTAGKLSNTNLDKNAALLRNNDEIKAETRLHLNSNAIEQTSPSNSGNITPAEYEELIDDLMQVGDRTNHIDNKVNIDGEIRYHYAVNNGPGRLDNNTSGIRARVGFDTKITKDFSVHGMLEGEKNLLNYNNDFKLARLYIAGKLGKSTVKAGSFDYLMADGNIYDSRFKGAKVDFGEPVKYSLSYGETDYTKETFIATARYNDFDYSLESGVYHYKMDDSDNKNTIWTLGGNYNFSNFGIGALYLGSSHKDSDGNNKGYVLSLKYGDLKTYRPGTYDIFLKHYDQPRGTYIDHGMNGMGRLMQGFKGYGIGTHYTIANNVVAGIEYFDLTDKVFGDKSQTLWCELTKYF